ncbi:hypothetical protein [Curtobacterium flaccumfaciens]|uniref:hypothetical protein n=1 Tax=Curtobacterium flaccumfaciens TaxID=2035 RepID=UPI00341DCEFE
MSTTSLRVTPDTAASAPSGAEIVARLGKPTLEIKGWHHKRQLHPDPNGLYRVVTQHRPYEGNRESIDAMPDTTTWGHRTPAEYQQLTTPGYQWGDLDGDSFRRPNEFVTTYVGLYRLVGYSADAWEGVLTGLFERVDGEVS